MSYTFLKAQGHEVGQSLLEADQVDEVPQVLAPGGRARAWRSCCRSTWSGAAEFAPDAEHDVFDGDGVPGRPRGRGHRPGHPRAVRGQAGRRGDGVLERPGRRVRVPGLRRRHPGGGRGHRRAAGPDRGRRRATPRPPSASSASPRTRSATSPPAAAPAWSTWRAATLPGLAALGATRERRREAGAASRWSPATGRCTTTTSRRIALTQKLAFALNAKDFAAADVAVLPPFTALRSVQTLIEGDKLQLLLRRPGPVAARRRRLHRRHLGPDAGQARLPVTCWPGTPSGGSTTTRTTPWSNAKVKAALRAAHHADPVRRESRSTCAQDGGQLVHCMSQLDGGLDGLDGRAGGGLVVAYEPVWAIGTGEVATPEDAQEVCGAIRDRISAVHGGEVAGSVRILYGGSVKPDNMPAIMASRTSTGRWSAGPASMPASSSGSAGIVS